MSLTPMCAMLRETLSQTDLILLPILAFILFLVAFIIAIARVLRRRADPRFAALERLPLAADAVTTTPENRREP